MTAPIRSYNEQNFTSLCDILTARDADLQRIVLAYGYPRPWIRPNTFQTLVLSILEQQVSLAAAYAAFERLRKKIGMVTPKKLLALTDQELRDCYFTRQKIVYARGLAQAILSKQISLRKMEQYSDQEVFDRLIPLKGIGPWTIDVYLMHALRRTDQFPLGDIALVNSLKKVKRMRSAVSKQRMLSVAAKWKPYRSIAAFILWHAYMQEKGTRVSH
ncbi:MAG: DNA-3-methyladenine glycosylase family protein [Sphingomonadales bacterium]